MTEAAVAAFVERLTTDVAFRDQLGAATTPEERLQMANDAGYDVGPDDIDAIREAMNAGGPEGVSEIADADLETVAGGMDDAGAAMAVAAISI